MNRILAGILGSVLVSGGLQAQDAALVERVNKLSFYVDELLEDKARQQQQVTDLKREVDSLRQQLQQASAAADREEVAALAETVKQLDRKHREDMDVVARQIEKLGKTPPPAREAAPAPSRQERGYEYEVKPGNTLSAIAKAYQDQGVPVTVEDILKANPGLDAKKLKVGQVIFIPQR
ncbi:MAG: LysM domain-containing protein [Verrucomicrobia bacterium]|jgi:LysM repeat protein|nr:LysM domain-containing protein [Verrucomicrobiota bacterium]